MRFNDKTGAGWGGGGEVFTFGYLDSAAEVDLVTDPISVSQTW